MKYVEIMLRRKSMFFGSFSRAKSAEEMELNKKLIAATIVDLDGYGYEMSKELFTTLYYSSNYDVVLYCTSLLNAAKIVSGSNIKYIPMYPNFPEEVENADSYELIYNQMIHYLSGGNWKPISVKQDRPKLENIGKNKIISLGERRDSFELVKNLLSSTVNISEQDREDIKELMNFYIPIKYKLPDEIPNKENLAFFTSILPDMYLAEKYYKTATDVLRYISVVSGGKASLEDNVKFKLNRRNRRFVMDLLAKFDKNSMMEDMFRYRNKWVKVVEVVHPFEIDKRSKNSKYSDVIACFSAIIENKKPVLFANLVNKMYENGNFKQLADILAERPGVFARSLDMILRNITDEDYKTRKYVLDKFDKVADQVSIPVLLQVISHMHSQTRNDGEYRIFYPKASTMKMHMRENTLNKIDEDVLHEVRRICVDGMARQAKRKPKYDCNVYVDPELKSYAVPLNQRSSSSGKNVTPRFSHIQIGDADYIRCFVWWTNPEKKYKFDTGSVIDVDLAAMLISDNYSLLGYCDYTTYYEPNKHGMIHSGDIVNGGSFDGDGAAEFIDIDLSKVGKSARYIAIVVNNFTGFNFSDMQHCKFGWMERTGYGQEGELFEPKTVKNMIDISASAKSVMPVIFDIRERRFIWCDFPVAVESYPGVNIANNKSSMLKSVYAMTNTFRPNLYGLAKMNYEARGAKIVYSRERADIIVSNNTDPVVAKVYDAENDKFVYKEREVKFITVNDIDIIMSEMM